MKERDIAAARGILSKYSRLIPCIVDKMVYDELAATPELADMMDRVAPLQPIPINPSNEVS